MSEQADIVLVVGGMTCGACAARIERRLNRLDGVSATVNYATGRAYVTSLGGREPGELISVITSAGYTAELPSPAGDGLAGVARPGPGKQTHRWPRRRSWPPRGASGAI